MKIRNLKNSKIMKSKILFIFLSGILFTICSNENSTSQSAEVDLNGSRYRGKAIEETPPDVDRMPLTLDEMIIFENGKISGEVMKRYSLTECNYTAVIDDRRMIAVKVVNFSSECNGVYNGETVAVKITGSIYGDLWMTAEILISNNGKQEFKFDLTGEAE